MEHKKGLHEIKITLDYTELDTIQRALKLAKRFIDNHNFDEFFELEGLESGDWIWREWETIDPFIEIT